MRQCDVLKSLKEGQEDQGSIKALRGTPSDAALASPYNAWAFSFPMKTYGFKTT